MIVYQTICMFDRTKTHSVGISNRVIKTNFNQNDDDKPYM